jgi:hypothetical protein
MDDWRFSFEIVRHQLARGRRPDECDRSRGAAALGATRWTQVSECGRGVWWGGPRSAGAAGRGGSTRHGPVIPRRPVRHAPQRLRVRWAIPCPTQRDRKRSGHGSTGRRGVSPLPAAAPAPCPGSPPATARMAAKVHVYSSALRGELDGVAQEIAEHIGPKAVGVGHDEAGGVPGHVDVQVDSLVSGDGPELLVQAAGEVSDVDLLEPEPQTPALHAADLDEVIHALAQRLCLLLEGAQDLPVARG